MIDESKLSPEFVHDYVWEGDVEFGDGSVAEMSIKAKSANHVLAALMIAGSDDYIEEFTQKLEEQQ